MTSTSRFVPTASIAASPSLASLCSCVLDIKQPLDAVRVRKRQHSASTAFGRQRLVLALHSSRYQGCNQLKHMPTHSGFLAEYPLIRVDLHVDDTPPLPQYVIDRLRSGRDAALDASIGDLHPAQTHFRSADIHLLSHMHSDHLIGLGDKRKWPDLVICSAATKEMLLRLETQKHRIAMDVDQADPNPPYRHLRITKKEASAARKSQGSLIKPRDVLRAVPLNTPTVIQYTQTTKVTITLIDANHMPGAVMFLIEGPRGAVLHTGDVRAEPWWIEKLRREPVLQRWIAWDDPNDSQGWATSFGDDGDRPASMPFESTLAPPTALTASGQASHSRLPSSSSILSSQASACPPPESTSLVLENIYIDTECLFFTKSALSKIEAVKETVRLIAQFPPTTPVFINCFTWGYEELLIGICRAFGQKIHVDKYKRMMYSHVAPDHSRQAPRDAGATTNIIADSHPFLQQILTLQEDGMRFHACERQNMCSWLRQFHIEERQVGETSKRVQQQQQQSPATEPSLEIPHNLPYIQPMEHASSLPSPSKKRMTEDQIDVERMEHMRKIRAKDKLPELLSSPINITSAQNAFKTSKGKAACTDSQQTILHLNPTEISAASWRQYVVQIQTHIDAAKKGEKPWPRYLFVPFARHSPLPELQSLTALFRPRTITPNTVSKRLGGWVYFILPRLFRSYLHRQDSSQMESECRQLLGDKNWVRAQRKEKELFALHIKSTNEREKRKRTMMESSTTTTTSDANSPAKSSISMPPPGQGRNRVSVGTAMSQSSSGSDSKISHLLASSGLAIDEAAESSLMLLRLLDHYLHKQPPALLQTMVGDKTELERHLSDLRRLAILNKDDEDEVEELADAFLQEPGGAELDGDVSKTDSAAETSFEMLSVRSRTMPSTANYDGDVSGAAPRARAGTGAGAGAAARIAPGASRDVSKVDDESDDWSIRLPRAGLGPVKVTQRGYEADADEDEEEEGEDDSRSTVRQVPSQSLRETQPEQSDASQTAEEDSQLSEMAGVRDAGRSPSLGATVPSLPREPSAAASRDTQSETQGSSQGVPSSPHPRMRPSSTAMSASLGEMENSHMFPSSPTSNVRAVRSAAAVAAAARTNVQAGLPEIRIQEADPSLGEAAGEDEGEAGSRLASLPVVGLWQHEPASSSIKHQQTEGGAKNKFLELALPLFESKISGEQAKGIRLSAYGWLAKGPPISFHGLATRQEGVPSEEKEDARQKLLRYVLQDIRGIQFAISGLNTALEKGETNPRSRMISLQIGIAAARLLGNNLAAATGRVPQTTLSYWPSMVTLLKPLMQILRFGPVLLRTIKHHCETTAASPWSVVRPAVLASAGLLFFILEAAEDHRQLATRNTERSLEKARWCLDGFSRMVSDAPANPDADTSSKVPARRSPPDHQPMMEGHPAKRRKVGSTTVPETSFYVPPSSSVERSQEQDQDQDPESDSFLVLQAAAARRTQLLRPGGLDLTDADADAFAQEGTSAESAAVSDGTIDRLSRDFRFDMLQRRGQLATGDHAAYKRSSLFDIDDSVHRPSTSGIDLSSLPTRRRLAGKGKAGPATGTGTEVEAEVGEEAKEALPGPSSRPMGPPAVSTGPGGISVDVSDTQWGQTSIDPGAVQERISRMAEQAQAVPPSLAFTSMYFRERRQDSVPRQQGERF
ncbi:unnamed protein product [Tilletia laevis]|uniref:Uncharacterized protein n=4 Tax=Tilletia TaxID=13289 RepID=A0A8X7SX92_9BASI|nr:hypothetical protein CF336_g3525 [Tilletia laevis]KAE8199538.1 hypothetical protein CF328_g3221 [Tilletia controversa]KAE8261940.1 hypothetical protein A4X03_0g2846 [Tilletia caries]KAE8204277.1 hypothetical protein CF335_g2712 [Tilletia laevis]KAE8248079.1 hypothetical protein A4X06_0g3974 [Tilletia controversa]